MFNLRKKYTSLLKFKVKYRVLLKCLLGMVVVGSLIGIENSQSFGCLSGLEMLSIGNLIFFSISSMILYKAFKSENQASVLILVAIESIIWILKYFFYKGGYVTGYAGAPSFINSSYDFLAIIFRSYLLLSLITQSKFKLISSILISVILVAIKINLFALPWFTKKKWELEDDRTRMQRTEIVGSYAGSIIQLADTLSLPIYLDIDSNQLTIKNEPPFDFRKNYLFSLSFPNFGSIGTDSFSDFTVIINKFDKDSLVLFLEEGGESDYLLRLNTER